MLFIEYPKCSTCMKAKKWLIDHKYEFDTRNIKENNPTKDELKKWHKLSGLEIRKIINTSGLLYKEYDLKNKIPNMSDDDIYELLSTNGMLVKRPILVMDDKVYFGFVYEKEL